LPADRVDAILEITRDPRPFEALPAHRWLESFSFAD
jgi:hypothetical protein